MPKRLIPVTLILALSILACSLLPQSGSPVNSATVPGSVLFQDDFLDRGGGWDRLMAAEGVMDYDAGGFRILVNGTQTNFWSTPHLSFSDVTVDVDAAKLAGPDENRIGVICRRSGDQYYFFMITSDGYYGIGLFDGEAAILLGQEQLAFSDRILTGMAVNRLSVTCAGQQLTLAVNGTQLASVSDTTLLSGDVGLMAGTFAEPGADIIFDNFVVRAP